MYDIALLYSAIRIENWEEIYNYTIEQNDCKVQLIFVGPVEPICKLPDNFKYIKTADIKPTQCVEVAYRNSNASFVMISADDVLIKGDKPLDQLLNKYYEINDYKVLISGIYTGSDGIPSFESMLMPSIKEEKPFVHMGIINKQLIEEIGFIDSNFIATWYDLDFILRARLYGSKVYFCNEVLIQEQARLWGDTQTFSFSGYDQELLRKIWNLRDMVNSCEYRTQEFIPFEDKDILLKSQGEKGKWI